MLRRPGAGLSALAAALAGLVAALPAQQDAPTRTVWDGVYTAAQARRGEAQYGQDCSVCHGQLLGGVDAAPALAGGAFLAKWSGVTLADMVERIKVSMPLNEPGRLSRQQTADVLAYILSFNQFPAGEAELPRQAGVLRQVMFQAARPGSSP